MFYFLFDVIPSWYFWGVYSTAVPSLIRHLTGVRWWHCVRVWYQIAFRVTFQLKTHTQYTPVKHADGLLSGLCKHTAQVKWVQLQPTTDSGQKRQKHMRVCETKWRLRRGLVAAMMWQLESKALNQISRQGPFSLRHSQPHLKEG